MPTFEKWHKGKRPTLQLDIVRNIASEGELSKIKLREILNANYPDVSDAIELLKKRKIIEWSRDDYKSRRAEHYYKLTRRGLEVIIDEFSDADIFWKAMSSYCSLSNDPVSIEEIEKYYKAFETEYVGYSQIHDLFSQFDFIDELFNSELKNRKGAITIFQKVMECIALHRSITLEQIIRYLSTQKTKKEEAALEELRKIRRDPNAQFGEFPTMVERNRYQRNDVTEENIMNILDRYTLSPDYQLEEFSDATDPVIIHDRYLDFLSHLLIRVVEDKTGKKYELSLFGVVLTLAVIHYDHLNPSKIFFNEFLDKEGRNNYYNIVVSNYKDKVSLIFAKWQQLTKCFHSVDHLMENFEPIFYKEIRDPLVSLPMNMGGVKELYENMRRVSYNRYVKLNEIYRTGTSVLQMRKKTNYDRLLRINKILSNIEQLLITADLQKFMIYITKQNRANIYKTNIVTSIENSFAYELSFLFYIALTRKHGFWPAFTDEHIFPARFVEFMRRGNEQTNIVKSRQILYLILKYDEDMKDDKEISEMKEVKDTFSLWLKNLTAYEKQVIENLSDLQSEVGIN